MDPAGLQPETSGMGIADNDFLPTAWPLCGNNAVSHTAPNPATEKSGTYIRYSLYRNAECKNASR